MTDNYQKLVLNNLKKLYSPLPPDLATNLPGQQEGQRFTFTAFGEECVIEPQKITLGNKERSSILGILISLYALNANPELCLAEPLKAFKEFPNSMPYIGAFTSHTEQVLVPYVEKIKSNIHRIKATLNGQDAPHSAGGDFSFTLYPLPKIALSYIFYEADEDFPASVKCLYSNNAHRFMPMDGLADVGEYTSKSIIRLL